MLKKETELFLMEIATQQEFLLVSTQTENLCWKFKLLSLTKAKSNEKVPIEAQI